MCVGSRVTTLTTHCATCPGLSPSLQLADSQLQRAVPFFLRLTHLAARILEPSTEKESGGLIVYGKKDLNAKHGRAEQRTTQPGGANEIPNL